MTSLPRTTWEGEEVRFVDALRTWDPLQMQPEPPAYPLYIGLGRLLNFFVHDPFLALVLLSVAGCMAGAAATAMAAGALLGNAWVGAAAALVLWLSPSLLVFGSMPSPESVVVAAIALALLALVRGRPALFGIAAAAVAGIQPETFPAVLVLVIGGCFAMRRWIPVVAAFTVAAAIVFVPVIEAVGIGQLPGYAVANFESLQTASFASGLGTREALLRFVAHPWGAKVLAFPLLIAAAAGIVLIRRHRIAVTLAAFAVVHIAFCVELADRGDGVQPAIPAMIAIALFSVAALARWPAVAVAASALYAAGSYAYAAPILLARRAGPSPPAAATMFARATLPPNAILLYDGSMEAYARHAGVAAAPIAGADPLAAPPDVPYFLLVDGGSKRMGAKTFAWPDSDAYGKITTERYRVVSLSPFRAAERYRPVSGVYGVQRTAGGEEWRWLSATAAIEVVPHSKEIAVALALPADTPIARNAVTISAGGAAQTVNVNRGQQVDVVLPLAGSRIDIRSAETFTSPDGRQLAVQLRGIEQRP